MTNKHFHKIIKDFLVMNVYKTAYIQQQKQLLLKQRNDIRLLYSALKTAERALDNAKSLGGQAAKFRAIWGWDGDGSNGKWRWSNVEMIISARAQWLLSTFSHVASIMPVQRRLQYCNLTNMTKCSDCTTCIVYLQKDHMTETYQEAHTKFYEAGWKQIYLPKQLQNTTIAIAFAPRDHSYAEFNGCDKCKSILHTVLKCPHVKCKICHKNGHVPRQCPDAICGICKLKGHITKFCQKFKCLHCGFQGHWVQSCKLLCPNLHCEYCKKSFTF